MKSWTRKDFLRTSFAGAAAILTGSPSGHAQSTRPRPATVIPTGSPNGDVRLGFIGFRGKGAAHIRDFGALPGVTIAGLCDVDEAVLARESAKLSGQAARFTTCTDFRRMLDDPSIDAVVITTPNHWHALMAIMACQAGKDVYVEKPVSHNVWEGRKIMEAAQRYGRIVQAGTQSRSDEALREAFAWIHAGNLGSIQWVRGTCYKLRTNIGRTSGPQPVPPGLDYDLWTGPAPLVAPHRNSPTYGSVHYDWHWFWNYGGGDIANQGIHEMDMCRWVLGQEALPPSVMSFGGRFGYEDDAETPNTQVAVFNYEPAPLIFEVRGLPAKAGMRAMDAYRGIRIGLVVQCEHGYFAGGASGGSIFDQNGTKVRQFSGPGGGGHPANFIAAVRSRKAADLNAPIESGHVSASLCHLANISYRLGHDTPADRMSEILAAHPQASDSLGRMLAHLRANQVPTDTQPIQHGPLLKLAPGRESFFSGEKYDPGYWANTMLRRDYRAPFVVPENV